MWVTPRGERGAKYQAAHAGTPGNLRRPEALCPMGVPAVKLRDFLLQTPAPLDEVVLRRFDRVFFFGLCHDGKHTLPAFAHPSVILRHEQEELCRLGPQHRAVQRHDPRDRAVDVALAVLRVLHYPRAARVLPQTAVHHVSRHARIGRMGELAIHDRLVEAGGCRTHPLRRLRELGNRQALGFQHLKRAVPAKRVSDHLADAGPLPETRYALPRGHEPRDRPNRSRASLATPKPYRLLLLARQRSSGARGGPGLDPGPMEIVRSSVAVAERPSAPVALRGALPGGGGPVAAHDGVVAPAAERGEVALRSLVPLELARPRVAEHVAVQLRDAGFDAVPLDQPAETVMAQSRPVPAVRTQPQRGVVAVRVLVPGAQVRQQRPLGAHADLHDALPRSPARGSLAVDGELPGFLVDVGDAQVRQLAQPDAGVDRDPHDRVVPLGLEAVAAAGA